MNQLLFLLNDRYQNSAHNLRHRDHSDNLAHKKSISFVDVDGGDNDADDRYEYGTHTKHHPEVIQALPSKTKHAKAERLNNSNVSNTSKSVTSRTSKSLAQNKKAKKMFKYVSPYVLLASKKAELRSKELAAEKARRARLNRGTNEWDNDTTTSALFDPKLHKNELFKLQPRTHQPPPPYFVAQIDNAVHSQSPPHNRNKMTIKTEDVSSA